MMWWFICGFAAYLNVKEYVWLRFTKSGRAEQKHRKELDRSIADGRFAEIARAKAIPIALPPTRQMWLLLQMLNDEI